MIGGLGFLVPICKPHALQAVAVVAQLCFDQ